MKWAWNAAWMAGVVVVACFVLGAVFSAPGRAWHWLEGGCDE